VTSDTNRRIDIGKKLVLRMLDEDDTVKDLAVKMIEELWFQSPTSSSSCDRSKGSVPMNDKGSLLKVAVIMGTSTHFKDRQSPLEDLLHKIIADKEGIEVHTLRACYAEICETLIDGLVDASDLPGFVLIPTALTSIY
jgi:cohesin loading factor subunit SCC2